MTQQPDPFLSYASPRPVTESKPRWAPPTWALVASVLPFPLIVLSFFTHGTWKRWVHFRQGWERLCGEFWIGAAVFSLISIIALSRARGRWQVTLCIILHALVIAATILPPGCIIIAWLMHWMTGPGA